MGISKFDESQYRQKIKEGLTLFDESFKGASKTKDFPKKKQLFDKSAKEALEAIEDAAKALMRNEILAQKDKLEKDYNGYLLKSTPENQEQVEKDIRSFKGILN